LDQHQPGVMHTRRVCFGTAADLKEEVACGGTQDCVFNVQVLVTQTAGNKGVAGHRGRFCTRDGPRPHSTARKVGQQSREVEGAGEVRGTTWYTQQGRMGDERTEGRSKWSRLVMVSSCEMSGPILLVGIHYSDRQRTS
jgi:hypothetical protein